MPRAKRNTQVQSAASKKKPAATKAAASKKKAPAKNAAPKQAQAKYTRTHALRDALSKGGSRDEIIAAVDHLYVENGGTSNPSGAKAMVGLHVPVLKEFGVVVEDDQGRLALK